MAKHFWKKGKSTKQGSDSNLKKPGKYRTDLNKKNSFVSEVSLATLNTENSEGFGDLEGPYPQLSMPSPVRWMVAPEANLKFMADTESDGMFLLKIRVMTISPSQHLKAFLNGSTILEKSFPKTGQWYSWASPPTKLQKGINNFRFEASEFTYPTTGAKRPLYVLFEELAFGKD